MTDPFTTNLNQARRRISSSLPPAEAAPVLAALRNAKFAHDRCISELTEAHHREARREGAVAPALRLLLIAIDLADQPGGIDDDHYRAAIRTARAALAKA
jgi:hypothetical protein